jgi:hypothetical protein
MENVNSWAAGAATASLPPLGGRTPAELAQIARDHPSYYALGAIGPDLFFFLPDFRAICILGQRVQIANPIIRVVESLDDFYAWLDGWILSRLERNFGPFWENMQEALSRITGDLSTVVRDVLGGLVSICSNVITNVVSQGHDWFGLFNLGLNKGYDNQDFFWSDMLHYRRTSRYARALWLRAERLNSDALRAYALGYMTHLGADTTGHAFVNEKSGGPYRLHWQRHHLVENHMDARTYADAHWSQERYNQYVESALHYKIAFEDDGSDHTDPLPQYPAGDETLRGLYVRRRMLDLDSVMPDDLANMLIDAMGDTYATGTPPTPASGATSSPRILPTPDGRPHRETVKTAYLLLFRYLKQSTLDGFRHEKPSPPEVFPNLQWPLLTDPHDEPPTAGYELPAIDSILKIVRFVLYLKAIGIWLSTILKGITRDLATYIPRLIAYYALELPIYYILKAERRVLVMTSYLHPMNDEIEFGLVTLGVGHDDLLVQVLQAMDDVLGGFVDAAIALINGNIQQALASASPLSAVEILTQVLGAPIGTFSEPVHDPNYPHNQPENFNGQWVEYHAPWLYPQTAAPELARTFAGPYQSGDVPQVLLAGQQPGSQNFRTQFESSPAPFVTDQISATVTATDHLGDPVNFSQYLIWQLTRIDPPPLTDWNLDSDRGYAYKCWDWNRHEHVASVSDQQMFQDQDGHFYMQPCTPPSQQDTASDSQKKGCAPLPTDGPKPGVPLQLHWADLPDPHCSTPQLAAFFKSRTATSGVTSVTLGIANIGTAAAQNVKITAVGGVGATGGSYTCTTVLPLSVDPTHAAGAVVPANLDFQPTGAPAPSFHFNLSVTADNVPQVTITIQVP